MNTAATQEAFPSPIAEQEVRQAISLCERVEAEIYGMRKRLEAALPPPVLSPDDCLTARDAFPLILGLVCEEFRVSAGAILGRGRPERIVFPRHAAMLLCREFLKTTLEETGDLFRRHHGAVLHGIRSILDRIDTNPAEALVVTRLRGKAGQIFSAKLIPQNP